MRGRPRCAMSRGGSEGCEAAGALVVGPGRGDPRGPAGCGAPGSAGSEPQGAGERASGLAARGPARFCVPGGGGRAGAELARRGRAQREETLWPEGGSAPRGAEKRSGREQRFPAPAGSVRRGFAAPLPRPGLR